MEVHIRPVLEKEYTAVESLVRDAFWNRYKPGCDEHDYLHRMRRDPAYLPDLEYLAEVQGEIVGQIAYARSGIMTAEGEVPTVTFGPVGVRPDLQGKGIGGKLIRHTLQLAKQGGHRAAVILGDPRYYGRFGFHGCERYDVCLDGMYLPGLLLLELCPGALQGIKKGAFREHFSYRQDPEALARFDSTFPQKAKEETDSQREFSVITHLAYRVSEPDYL